MQGHEQVWEYRNPYQWMERIRTSSLPPLIICCAITGGVQGKESNENLPETPEEQAEQTYEAYQAGATIVHVHARNPEKWYSCSGDAEQYRLVNGMIRERCPDIIINNTTGGEFGMTPEQRAAVLDANPEMASLNSGTDIADMVLKERKAPLPHPRPEVHIEGCTPVDYAEVKFFARAMKERGIKPELEMWHPGSFWIIDELIKEDLIDPPYFFQFVMGYQTAVYATPDSLMWFVNQLPENSVFGTAGMAAFQLPMAAMSVILGGHVRVGMEDNVYRSRGQLLKSNAEAVERIARVARDLNREIATPAQAREILGLSQTPSKY